MISLCVRRRVVRKRAIVPACDVDSLWKLDRLVEATCAIPGIDAYKIGMTLTERFGVRAVVKRIRAITTFQAIIWDRQKAATDIPPMGKEFANIAFDAMVDGVIIFPQAGPATERAWLKELNTLGVPTIVGLHMTHANYTESEGGWILDRATQEAFDIAIDAGVTDFVLPGNKPEVVAHYTDYLSSRVENHRAWAPGFISQGGDITECGKAAGDRWCAIVGTALTSKITTPRGTSVEEITEVGKMLTAQIKAEEA